MKVRIKNVKYIVRPKEGIVMCQGIYYICDLYNFVNSRDLPDFSLLLNAENIIAIKAIGVAKCDDKDTFDEKAGKRIACMKMRIKLYEKIQKLIYRLDDRINKLCDVENKILDKVNANHLYTTNALREYCK